MNFFEKIKKRRTAVRKNQEIINLLETIHESASDLFKGYSNPTDKSVKWVFADTTLFIWGKGEVSELLNRFDIEQRTIYDPHGLGPWYSNPGFGETDIRKQCKTIVILEGITKFDCLLLMPCLEKIYFPKSLKEIGSCVGIEKSCVKFHVCKNSFAFLYVNDNRFQFELYSPSDIRKILNQVISRRKNL